MTTTLRPYQIAAVEQIRQAYAEGSKGVILQLSTGSGKTAIFCTILKSAYEKGRRGIMLVRGKSLVHQASERLRREGVPHGIYQGQNTRNIDERIVVCSVDTLYSRKEAPRADIAVIDEVHLSGGDGYDWVLSQYPGVFKIGVSATPHHRRGMRHIGDRLIRPASFTELVEQHYLVGGRYFVPFVPNLRGVKKSGGDFNAKELARRSVDDQELTASAAKVWSNHLRGRSCLVFAVSIEHAKVLADGIRGVGGRCELVTASTKDGLRRDYIRRLENGEIDCLVSVGVLTTGVDIPSLKAILCCRPTESYNLHIQIIGRCTRTYPGKDSFLCYDLSGNLYRFGPIEAELIADLDGIPDVPKISLRTCEVCYAVFESGPEVCPGCGGPLSQTKERKTGKRIHGLTENDEVKEYKVEPWEIELPNLVAKAKTHGWRKGFVYHVLKNKYGNDVADKAWPKIRSMKKWPVKTKVQAPANTHASSEISLRVAEPVQTVDFGKIKLG